jgi:REP element-mobilizing transposase RayT
MPRTARGKSKSGIYHIIIRGANRQEIFHDKQDNLRFLEILERFKEKTEIKIHGWCLMNNHIHLLMEEGNEELATTMKRIGVSFVGYYHLKYDTTGHLFQDRYKSENVESEEYLITVIRYIHQNPVKAGLVSMPQEWKWSSCAEYYGEKPYQEGLLDGELILKLFSDDKYVAIKKFREFNEKKIKIIV